MLRCNKCGKRKLKGSITQIIDKEVVIIQDQVLFTGKDIATESKLTVNCDCGHSFTPRGQFAGDKVT